MLCDRRCLCVCVDCCDFMRGAGIVDGAVAAAFDAEAIDWLDVAREWFARRHTPGTTPAERARHWRRLAGRGFDEGTVRAVLGDAPEFE